jgi:hypothetical protein
MIKLFPETPGVLFNVNHFRFLNKCLEHKEGILQKEMIKILGLNKTSLSEIKHDLIGLQWCKDVNLGSGKEITIKPCKINEIKQFLGQWQSIEQTISIRPHDIVAKSIFLNKPDNFEVLVNKLTRDYRVIISEMKNNKQYTVVTDYGKIIFYLKGKLIRFHVEGFILPISKDHVSSLEEYIYQGINERLLKLHSLMKEHFEEFRVEIMDTITLKSLHIGILTKKNVARVLSLHEDFKGYGLFKDKSIYGLEEYEVKGKVDLVLQRVTDFLNHIFERMEEIDDNCTNVHNYNIITSQ